MRLFIAIFSLWFGGCAHFAGARKPSGLHSFKGMHPWEMQEKFSGMVPLLLSSNEAEQKLRRQLALLNIQKLTRIARRPEADWANADWNLWRLKDRSGGQWVIALVTLGELGVDVLVAVFDEGLTLRERWLAADRTFLSL